MCAQLCIEVIRYFKLEVIKGESTVDEEEFGNSPTLVSVPVKKYLNL